MNGIFSSMQAGFLGKQGLFFLCVLLVTWTPAPADQVRQTGNNIATNNSAFSPGEILTYSISWSNIVQAGVAAMEVRQADRSNGVRAYELISTARSVGMVATFYTVRDTVTSALDAQELYSLSYHLDQIHGKRKKKRLYVFDQESGSVETTTDGKKETFDVPPRVQDALSSLYYLRTRNDFSNEQPIIIDVFDSGKNWAVEVHTLGRETIKTALGTFQAIKVKTHPKYEGVFQHKGEIFLRL